MDGRAGKWRKQRLLKKTIKVFLYLLGFLVAFGIGRTVDNTQHVTTVSRLKSDIYHVRSKMQNLQLEVLHFADYFFTGMSKQETVKALKKLYPKSPVSDQGATLQAGDITLTSMIPARLAMSSGCLADDNTIICIGTHRSQIKSSSRLLALHRE